MVTQTDFHRHFELAGHHGFMEDVKVQVIDRMFGESRVWEGFWQFNPFCGNEADLLQNKQAAIIIWPRFQITFHLSCIVMLSLPNMLLGEFQLSDARGTAHRCFHLSFLW